MLNCEMFDISDINVQEKFCIAGGFNFLVSIDREEALSFGQFGNMIGKLNYKLAMLQSSSIMDCNFISVVGSVLNISEIYYRGMCLLVNMSYVETVRILQNGISSFINMKMYSVQHKELAGHIILVAEKDTVKYETISFLTGSYKWKNLNNDYVD